MKINEKKFICDVASIILAIAVLCCGLLLFINPQMFGRMMPLVFAFGALMFISLSARSRLYRAHGWKVMLRILSVVMCLLFVGSLLCPGV